MKAIVYHEYGTADVLRCEEVERPTPAADEVLIRVRAASLNPLDWRLMNGKPVIARLAFGFPRPHLTRPGRDVAGEVEAVGNRVTQFRAGDAVFGTCSGALAEYACAPETALAMKPAAVTFEQAASVPVAAYSALQGLRDHGELQAGQKVLINGAAGGVGTFAVQIAKALGADVTGVCSTRNLELIRSLGADHAIDYTREDFTRGEQRYDLILECVGNQPLSACRRVLNPKGRCVVVGASKQVRVLLGHLLQALVLSPFIGQKYRVFVSRSSQPDLTLIGDLIATGKVTPVLDTRHGLNAVPEAMRHLQAGHARGKVVISLDHSHT